MEVTINLPKLQIAVQEIVPSFADICLKILGIILVFRGLIRHTISLTVKLTSHLSSSKVYVNAWSQKTMHSERDLGIRTQSKTFYEVKHTL